MHCNDVEWDVALRQYRCRVHGMQFVSECLQREVEELTLQVEGMKNVVQIAREVKDSIAKSGRVESGSMRFMDLQTALGMLDREEKRNHVHHFNTTESNPKNCLDCGQKIH